MEDVQATGFEQVPSATPTNDQRPTTGSGRVRALATNFQLLRQGIRLPRLFNYVHQTIKSSNKKELSYCIRLIQEARDKTKQPQYISDYPDQNYWPHVRRRHPATSTSKFDPEAPCPTAPSQQASKAKGVCALIYTYDMLIREKVKKYKLYGQ